MSYPYGPQRGPMPGAYQAPYPANPGPYPNAGGYPPGYGYGAPGFGQPSGGTALAAGFLGVVVGLLCGFSATMALNAANEIEKLSNRLGQGSAQEHITGLQTIGGINIVVGLLWFLGALLLIGRKRAGRVILILLSCVGGVLNLVSAVISLGSEAPAAGVGSIIGLILALLILILAASGSTGRWLAAAPRRHYGPPYGQPTPPPYGQPTPPPYGQPTPPPYGQPAQPAPGYGQQPPPRY
ncbi:hypothetical protein IU433_22660 [Nocardia puris]|uniref:hypothetical protein n=1 Tax=Nocardia puris TaxID=208602 RepID=UPI001895948C|nr:hypothetical protein [Nocardia puris]MBF6215028.1 hypothetical protein [Nocardia puris]MBF6367205.1 hypothetical protein [Nocardia puris]MBF6461818.1 hypothetical protein [Nocardia puris]